jgi:adenine-specific DNA-methyltransferase
VSITLFKYYAAMSTSSKELGQYFTPPSVAKTLTDWVIRSESDCLLDPSCGNGEILLNHRNSFGVELDREAFALARTRASSSTIIHDDFFTWASITPSRFEAVAGNPPFIRYQRFKGDQRTRALNLSASAGAKFSGLSSSWAPFLVCASELLKVGGRMAFVVPAEIGHSTYAPPLLEYLVSHFSLVHVVAIRSKLFPELSEDAWLLYCEGFGASTETIGFSCLDSFGRINPRKPRKQIALAKWRFHGSRLRKFLLEESILDKYENVATRGDAVRLGEIARTGIGYVTGDNSFFHLKPSEAKELGIPRGLLRVAVRKGDQLRGPQVDKQVVKKWLEEDREVMLLDLKGSQQIPLEVRRYLDSSAGKKARKSFKCRNRDPWYAVPDVSPPDAFLSYMNGNDSVLALNRARCVCTNSLLAVRFRNGADQASVATAWTSPFSRLSQELEGHPLGGGMLKLEPGEAAGVLLPKKKISSLSNGEVLQALRIMREWRHAKTNGHDPLS